MTGLSGSFRIGQFVDGSSSWAAPPQIPASSSAWTLGLPLVTPISGWDPSADRPGGFAAADHRASRVCSWRLWRRNFLLCSPFGLVVGGCSLALQPTRAVPVRHDSADRRRKLTLAPRLPGQPATQRLGEPWELLARGPRATRPAGRSGPWLGQPPSANWAFNSANPAVHLDPQRPKPAAAEHPSRGAGSGALTLGDHALAPLAPAGWIGFGFTLLGLAAALSAPGAGKNPEPGCARWPPGP